MRLIRHFILAAALVAIVAVRPSVAGPLTGVSSIPGYTPRVPISGFARPAWFDPSRFHMSTSVSVGSGFGGQANALQVTSLSYQFEAPLRMNVNLGSVWGGSSRTNNMFLEGVDVAYQPFRSLLFQVHYRDFRSPLQLSRDAFDTFAP